MNFTLCKNRCNYTKRNKQSRNPPLSVQPFQNRTIPCPAPPPLPPLSKVRCCRPKEFGRLPEGLLHHSFQNRTTPCFAPSRSPFVTTTSVCACFASALSHLAFRRVSVCVCLVGFASLQSPWAHTLKASLPCLLLPLHRASPFPQPSQKHINRFAPHHVFTSPFSRGGKKGLRFMPLSA